MASTVTYNFRDLAIDKIFEDIDSSGTHHYVGIGRSQDWEDSDGSGSLVPDAASNSPRVTRNLRQNLQSIKKVSDREFVVPRYNWSTGTIYSAYDDAYTSNSLSNPYYVMTSDNSVYICLQQGTNNAGAVVTSTVLPSGTSVDPFKTADGYVWKYLFTLTSGNANKYLSANFLPVTFVDSAGSGDPLATQEQYNVQNAADSGEIIGIVVTSGGTGYTSAPTVTINGDGSGASAVATVSGGAITKIEIKDSDGLGTPGFQYGTGYRYATVEFSGGGGAGAIARTIHGPLAGIGANPREDLRASSLMVNVKIDGAEGGDFITDNDYRQISFFKNFTQYDSSDLFIDATGDCLRKLKFDTGTYSGTIVNDMLITQSSSGASAYVDNFDGTDTIRYHQTEETGFVNFQENAAVTFSGGGFTLLTTADSALIAPDIDIYSGEVLYFDNRATVSRAADQTEDVKIVIQF